MWLADRWTSPSPLKSRALRRPCSSSYLPASTLWRMWRSTVTLACFDLAGSETAHDFHAELARARPSYPFRSHRRGNVDHFHERFFQSQVWLHLHFHFDSCCAGLWLTMRGAIRLTDVYFVCLLLSATAADAQQALSRLRDYSKGHEYMRTLHWCVWGRRQSKCHWFWTQAWPCTKQSFEFELTLEAPETTDIGTLSTHFWAGWSSGGQGLGERPAPTHQTHLPLVAINPPKLWVHSPSCEHDQSSSRKTCAEVSLIYGG